VLGRRAGRRRGGDDRAGGAVAPAGHGAGRWLLPVFCSALGRALASGLPDKDLDAYLTRLQPERFTRQTVLAKPDIRKAILDVRKRGYALVDQEAEVGIRSIAVPLQRFDGRPVAALNIGVQPEQVPARTMIADYAPLLLQEAAALKEQLV
jgi:IclR family transcriptional regulator, pca regulon regulatory protein